MPPNGQYLVTVDDYANLLYKAFVLLILLISILPRWFHHHAKKSLGGNNKVHVVVNYFLNVCLTLFQPQFCYILFWMRENMIVNININVVNILKVSLFLMSVYAACVRFHLYHPFISVSVHSITCLSKKELGIKTFRANNFFLSFQTLYY